MSHKRLIDTENESFYHVIIKVSDRTDPNSEYAFKDQHKEKLRELFFWLEEIYSLDCLSYCIMSTHAHFIIRRRPKLKLSQKEIALRHQSYYQLKWPLDARSAEIIHFGKRLNDLSHFIGDLEKRFTHWFNKQFQIPRRGSLWNPCYKSVLLEGRMALERCLQYVELNPVRAKMVAASRDYKFCSWHDICQKNDRGNLLKSRIIESLRAMGAGLQESDDAIFMDYQRVLSLMTVGVDMNPGIKKFHQGLELELLHRQGFWAQAYSITSESGHLYYVQGRRRFMVS